MIRSLICLVFLFTLSTEWAYAKKLWSPYVARIEIEGNNKTKASVILRELSFKVGEQPGWGTMEEEHIPRSTANLKRLDLFNQIQITSKLNNTRDSIYVKILVVEKWYLLPIPFVEFADRNFNQWYSLDLEPYRTNYGLYLFKNNLWGLNHTAKLTFGRGYTNTLAFQYVAPYIDKKKKLGFEVDVRQRTNREIQYDVVDNQEQFFRDLDQVLINTKSLKGKLVFRPKLYLSHILASDLTSISIADTVLSESLNRDFLYQSQDNQRLGRIAYAIEYDKQNNTFLPMKGVFFKTELVYNKFLQGGKSFLTATSQLSLFQRLPAADRISGGVSGIVSHSSSKDLPYNLSRALGYQFYNRGYENNVILGTSFGLLKYEARYSIIKERNFFLKYMPIKPYKNMPTEAYLSVFIDHGFAHYRGTNQPLVGYGVGLNTLFYFDKVVRFEYSWNKAGLGSIKLHFKKAF